MFILIVIDQIKRRNKTKQNKTLSLRFRFCLPISLSSIITVVVMYRTSDSYINYVNSCDGVNRLLTSVVLFGARVTCFIPFRMEGR